jgi:hypothetical protein
VTAGYAVDLDGKAVEAPFDAGAYQFSVLPTPTPVLTPIPTPKLLMGDLNSDGKVNVLDLSLLLSAWGRAGGTGDINHDQIVNVVDLSMLLSRWTG